MLTGPSGNWSRHWCKDAHALAHFLHAHEVAVVAIADRADGNVELQMVVNEIGMRLAQIEIHAAAAQVRAGQAVINGVLLGNHADVPRAVHENAVAREQFFRLVEIDDDFVQEFAALLDPARRQVARNAADARVAGGEPRAGQGFDQIINLFALGEGVQENRQRADIHRERAQPEQMRGDAGEFAADDADVLAARRQVLVDPVQFFHRERVGDVVGQRREIIQPIRVGDELGVGHVLGDFFIAAMEITDVGSGLGDDLAVQFQHDAQHAVRGGMRRPHVQDHFLALHVRQFRRRRGHGSGGRGSDARLAGL